MKVLLCLLLLFWGGISEAGSSGEPDCSGFYQLVMLRSKLSSGRSPADPNQMGTYFGVRYQFPGEPPQMTMYQVFQAAQIMCHNMCNGADNDIPGVGRFHNAVRETQTSSTFIRQTYDSYLWYATPVPVQRFDCGFGVQYFEGINVENNVQPGEFFIPVTANGPFMGDGESFSGPVADKLTFVQCECLELFF